MFKVYANGNFINEVLGYHTALEVAKRCKANYGKDSTITVEDIKGRIIDTF